MNKIKVDENNVPMSVVKRIGEKHQSLTILSYSHSVRQSNKTSFNYYVLCKCDCGKEKVINMWLLTTNRIQSCGCYSSKLKSERFTKHGMSFSREYRIFRAMHERCYNSNNTKYHLYGGKGVQICNRWRSADNFKNFILDMGECPIGYSIDRKDSNGNYSCGKCDECIANGWSFNCRWADYVTQNSNTSRNRKLMFYGESMTITKVSRLTGISPSIISYRIKNGWGEYAAMTIPTANNNKILRLKK